MDEIGGASIPFTVEQAAARIASTDRSPIQIKGDIAETLVTASRNFHLHAGTDTPPVQSALKVLPNSLILRTAHQPNIFPYLGVCAQPLSVHALAAQLETVHKMNTVELFLLVDDDDASDRRFKTAHLPDPCRRGGSATLSAANSYKYRGRAMWSVPLPSMTQLDNWLKIIERYAATYKSCNHIEHQQRLHIIESDIQESWNRASSLADFNAIFLSRLVNLRWGLPTIFVPISKTRRYFRSAYIELLSYQKKTSSHILSSDLETGNGLLQRPFWAICSQCGYRYSLVSGSMDINYCPICSTPLRASDSYVLTPSVIYDDVADTSVFRAVGGCAYAGGAEHHKLASIVMRKLGLNIPVDIIWRPVLILNSQQEEFAKRLLCSSYPQERERARLSLDLVLRGKASILYYLLAQGITDIANMWFTYLCDGGNTNEILTQGLINMSSEPHTPENT